jgi:predicted phage terminase large subunit-like protein
MRVVVTAYGQKLANRFSRAARRLAREQGFALGDVEQVDEWETAQGGSFMSRGMGSGVTGNPADLLIIDDPYKDSKQAKSPTYRESVWEWWTDALSKRLSKDAQVIVIHTRWHSDDITGRFLQTGDGWRHLKMKAIAEDGDQIGRQPGEALCPELHPIEQLESQRAENPISFLSMGQQEPMDLEGGFFRGLERLDILDAMPSADQFVERVRGWDLASTEKQAGTDPDWTAGVLMGKHRDGTFYVLDVVRVRLGPAGVRGIIRQTAQADGQDVRIAIEREGGSSGNLAAYDIVKELAGWNARAIRPKGNKAERAEPWGAQIEAGNVRIVRNANTAALLDEHRAFPSGSHDDLVDAASLSFSELTARGGFSFSVNGERVE